MIMKEASAQILVGRNTETTWMSPILLEVQTVVEYFIAANLQLDSGIHLSVSLGQGLIDRVEVGVLFIGFEELVDGNGRVGDCYHHILWFSGHRIGDILRTRSIADDKVITLEEFHPSDLTAREFLLCGEILERSMICFEGKLSTLNVDTPGLERMDDGKQFLFVDWVVQLGGTHLS